MFYKCCANSQYICDMPNIHLIMTLVMLDTVALGRVYIQDTVTDDTRRYQPPTDDTRRYQQPIDDNQRYQQLSQSNRRYQQPSEDNCRYQEWYQVPTPDNHRYHQVRAENQSYQESRVGNQSEMFVMSNDHKLRVFGYLCEKSGKSDYIGFIEWCIDLVQNTKR